MEQMTRKWKSLKESLKQVGRFYWRLQASMPDSSRAQQAHGVPNQLPGLSRLQHTLLSLKKQHTSSPEEHNKMSWNNAETAWKMDCMRECGKEKAGMEVTAKQRASIETSFQAALNCKTKLYLWSWLLRGWSTHLGLQLGFKGALIYWDWQVWECMWVAAAAIKVLRMCYK